MSPATHVPIKPKKLCMFGSEDFKIIQPWIHWFSYPFFQLLLPKQMQQLIVYNKDKCYIAAPCLLILYICREFLGIVCLWYKYFKSLLVTETCVCILYSVLSYPVRNSNRCQLSKQTSCFFPQLASLSSLLLAPVLFCNFFVHIVVAGEDIPLNFYYSEIFPHSTSSFI